MLADETVRKHYPKSWDELEPADRENLISTVATGNTITLGNHLRSMAGGWNERSDYGAIQEWAIGKMVEEQREQQEQSAEEPDDPRWQAIKAIPLHGKDAQRKIALAKAIAEEDGLIGSYKHAGQILKHFGYTAAGKDRVVHWQMAQMVWMYAKLRDEGAEQNQALALTAGVFGHPEELIQWFDVEPGEDSAPYDGETEERQVEVDPGPDDDADDLEDEMAF
jgi:hypothetical protein